MPLYRVFVFISLIWTMCFVAVLIATDSRSYQFYEPMPIQEKESQPMNRNVIVSEEEIVQPTPSIVPKNTLLQHTLQNELKVKVLEEDSHHVHDELHTLHRQLRMIHRQLRVIERNYHHMEQKTGKGKEKETKKETEKDSIVHKGVSQKINNDVWNEMMESKEKVKEIKKQYQDLRESYLYTKKRLRQLKNSLKN